MGAFRARKSASATMPIRNKMEERVVMGLNSEVEMEIKCSIENWLSAG